jgi:hypothetical protein
MSEFPTEWATPPQKEIFTDPARFRIVIAGRRFGKSYLSAYEIMRAAFSLTGATIVYVAPTRDRAKELGWTMVKKLIHPQWIERSLENELTMTIKGLNNTLHFKGSDNADQQLRGFGMDFVVIDEFPFIKGSVWHEVIRPALSDRMGSAMLIGTPAGFNWGYDLFEMARRDTTGEYKAWQFTTLEGGNVSAREVESARKTLSPSQFAQEYLASFSRLGNRVYSNFDTEQNVSPKVEKVNGQSILIGMDFNVDPMCCCIGHRINDELHIFDEIVIENSRTQEMCDEIKTRYPNEHIRVYPDPTGRRRVTSAHTGQTDHSIIQDSGFSLITPGASPGVADRINEVQSLLMNTEGRRRLLIHPRCTRLIYSLSGLTYKENTSQQDKASGLDHMPDALGYLVHMEFPINTQRFRRRTIRI